MRTIKIEKEILEDDIDADDKPLQVWATSITLDDNNRVVSITIQTYEGEWHMDEYPLVETKELK